MPIFSPLCGRADNVAATFDEADLRDEGVQCEEAAGGA